jgi:hypothetical protein
LGLECRNFIAGSFAELLAPAGLDWLLVHSLYLIVVLDLEIPLHCHWATPKTLIQDRAERSKQTGCEVCFMRRYLPSALLPEKAKNILKSSMLTSSSSHMFGSVRGSETQVSTKAIALEKPDRYSNIYFGCL